MIQIQRPEQFTKAADRLNSEPQSIRRQEPHLYEVTNKRKGHTYHVRITRMNGSVFGSCTCKAGLRHHAAPLACKHLAAVIIYLRALRAMRERVGH
jgi:hypothetical protein